MPLDVRRNPLPPNPIPDRGTPGPKASMQPGLAPNTVGSRGTSSRGAGIATAAFRRCPSTASSSRKSCVGRETSLRGGGYGRDLRRDRRGRCLTLRWLGAGPSAEDIAKLPGLCFAGFESAMPCNLGAQSRRQRDPIGSCGGDMYHETRGCASHNLML